MSPRPDCKESFTRLVPAPCPLPAWPYAHPRSPSSPPGAWVWSPTAQHPSTIRHRSLPASSLQPPTAHVQGRGWGQTFSHLFPRSHSFFHPGFWSKCFCFPSPFKLLYFFLIKAHSCGWKGTQGNRKERAQQKEMVIWGIPSCPHCLTETQLKNRSVLFKSWNNH